MDFDTTVKLHVYRTIAETAKSPKVSEVAAALNASEGEIARAFRSLRRKRLLVLEPGTSEIRMAPPFSAVETTFRVHVDRMQYFANCVWDALGVAVALRRDVDVTTSCGDCGLAMSMQVRGGAPVRVPCVIHFAVPAAHWWDDIIHT